MTAKKFSRIRARARIAMITAYDAPGARAAAEAGVDWLLIGDSAAMVVHGFDSTRKADIAMMRSHTQAVRNGAPRTPIVADLPYPSVRQTNARLIRDAQSLLRSGADAVKIEWTAKAEAQTAALVRAKIPVMGHVGLTPQDVEPGGPFKLRGTEPSAAAGILRAALAFERLGAFSVVVECVPETLGKQVTDRLKVPVIGIGAGRYCDGQVLVYHDALGLIPSIGARFVKRYAEAGKIESAALKRYADEVRRGAFPQKKHVYGAL